MNLTIKNVPLKVHRRLKAQADANKRSLNGEVIEILEKAVQSQPLDTEALLAEIEQVRARLKGPPLTEEILREARNGGRP
jgi:plasmid stability protein